MTEETPHPAARMATITRLSFWIFFGACILLYVYNQITASDSLVTKSHSLNNFVIFIVAFAGLFLNLISITIKNPATNRILNITCYVFEIGSIVVLGLLNFLKWAD